MERAAPELHDNNSKLIVGTSITIVSLIHVGLLLLLDYVPVVPLEPDLKIINIELVSPQVAREPELETDIELPPPSDIAPRPKGRKIETSKNDTAIITPPPSNFEDTNIQQPDIKPPVTQTSPNRIENQQFPTSPEQESSNAIAPQWILRTPNDSNRQRRKIGSPSLEASLDCLKGFSVDCAVQRKDIFAAEQLTQTDLVWMPSFAHSGLDDADLYGLSEAEIRKKLGIPTAGENGAYIPFTNIGLDGPLWDILHGVNKTCGHKIGVARAKSARSGQRIFIKSCPELKSAQKDLPLHRQGTEFDRPSE